MEEITYFISRKSDDEVIIYIDEDMCVCVCVCVSRNIIGDASLSRERKTTNYE